MVSGQEAAASLGNLLEMQILMPYPDLLDWKLWSEAQESAVTGLQVILMQAPVWEQLP